MAERKPSNPMERMIAEFTNIVRFLKEHENKPMNPQLSAVMEKRLEILRKGVEKFKQISEKVIAESGNKQPADENARLAPGTLSREEKKEWEKLQYLKEELGTLAPKVRENANKRLDLSELMKTEKKAKKVRRKGVAKGSGYNEEWKKL